MPLDTEVDKQSETIRTASRWMDGAATAVDSALDTLHGSRGDSETAWPRGAGESFREMSGKATPGIGDTGTGFTDFAGALREFADGIDTIETRMRQARELALQEGLEIHGFLIMEPGPEPPTPAPLPPDQPATPEQQQAHAAGTQAQQAFAKKVAAYSACAVLVDEARATEHSVVAMLNRFIGGLVEKAPFNTADVLTGVAGAHAGRTAALRAKATKLAASGGIEITERMMHNPSMSLAGRTKAAALHIEKVQELQAVQRKAISGSVSSLVDRLSPRSKRTLRATITKPGNTSGIIRGARSTGAKIPVAGALIAAGGVGYDIYTGKDPATSVASAGAGLGGTAAGTAALAAMGTPVGWAVAGGAVIGWGASFAVSEWGGDALDGAVQVGERLQEINPKMTR